MGRKLFILHTTGVTLEPLLVLFQEAIPNSEIFNILDDSILPELIRHEGNVDVVADRVISYIQFAALGGADLVLIACSSIGELVDRARYTVSIPVVRIDEAMAEKAISMGGDIAVLATLSTTLGPTLRLLECKAQEMERQVHIVAHLADPAYKSLVKGDRDGHDRLLIKKIHELYHNFDVIVLAQASMTSILTDISDLELEKVLTSPLLGVEKVKSILVQD